MGMHVSQSAQDVTANVQLAPIPPRHIETVVVDFDLPVPMRDGTVLRANVYRPADGGPWPTLLTRLPYGKDLPNVVGKLDPVQVAARGFVVVIQDTRGRFMSQGEWDPFRFEHEDGFDTVEWAARLPSSNGRVGMYGDSYFGNSQWAAAIANPPSLSAISPALTWADPMDGLFARGGAVELGLNYPWTLQQGFDLLQRLPLSDSERRRRIASLAADIDQLSARGYWELPVGNAGIVRRHSLPDLGGLRALCDPTIAARCSVSDHYDEVAIPTLHTAGWHDIFLQGTLDNYVALAALGRDARLVVGPWTHMEFADPIGDLHFGLNGARFGAPAHLHGDLVDFQLAWFRHNLTSDADAEMPSKPVRLFVMGRNQWRDENHWPLTRSRRQCWFLRTDRSLTIEAPATSDAPAEFFYNPADPVPTTGGNTVMAPAYPAGPREQGIVEARKDVCVFTSQAFDRELEVTGRIKVVLHTQSTAVSTDWVARLCDVYPDGRSFNLCDGIIRVEKGADSLGRHEIDLWSTSNVFLPGHRLRVHITSSSFPRWDRNLNTGDQGSAHFEVARQHLFLDGNRPSWIELPVIE